MTERSFVPFLLEMLAPFLVWGAHFGAVYGINGIACARGLDAGASGPVGIAPASLAILGVSAAALVAVGWLLVRALRRAQAGRQHRAEGGSPGRDAVDFARWFAAAGAGAALIAVLWVTLPVLQVPACA
ncbi:hypothetical protein [Arenibaculum pallidiluteum]|uniref:hypothetical protein n=1 Tax=Arenibaculum pallidiluteum TaxID=2812559 RepID=UPI001A974DB7|nr:hypothetical protein [Arenibaculum pallidiluteum]